MYVKLLQLSAIWLLCCACTAQTPPTGEIQRKSPPPAVEGIGRISQVHVGGSGQFLVLRLEDRLAIFDILQSKITAHVPLPSDKAVVAAGKSILVVIDPVKKRIQRWSLPVAERLSESALDLEMIVGHAAIGAATDGPLLLIPEPCRWPIEEVRLLNPTTLKPVVTEVDLLGRAINSPGRGRPGFVTASDDGTTFYVGPAGLSLRVEPDRVVGRFCTEIDWTNTMQPGRIGRYLFGWGVPLDQRDRKATTELIDQARTRGAESQITIHDHGGPYYLSMRPRGNGSDLEAFYMAEGELEPLGKVPGVMLKTGKDHLPVAQRVHLHSRAGVIVTLNDRIGRIDVHHTSPGELLRPNDPKRLALRTPSRLTVYAKQTFAHQVQLVGQGNEITFEVVGGPDGLTVDEKGVLRWLPPELGKDMTIDCGLRASLGENQVVHRLVITIRSSRAGSGDSQPGSMQSSKRAVAKWLIDSPTKGWLAGNALAEPHDEPIKLKVETRPSVIQPAAEGRVFVFRQPGSISILSTQSGKLIAKLPAPHTGTQFAAGLDCIVVHDPVDHTLTRWQLDDLTISHQVKAPFEDEARLALLGASSSGPFLVESRGSRAMHCFDSQTLESLAMPPVVYRNQRLKMRPDLATAGKIAENGTTLSAASYNDIVSFVPTGTKYRAYAHQQSRPNSVRMSPDGRYFYSNAGIFDRYGRPQQFKFSGGVILPAVSGPLFCHVLGEQYQVGSTFRPKHGYKIHAQVYHRFLPESLSTLKDLPLVKAQKYLRRPNLDDEQIWFVPTVNRLVRFDSRSIEFVFHHWDVGSALKRLPTLQPIIVSSPQIWVRRGSQWSYQLEALPRGKVTFRLPVAPDGMELNEGGKVTWNVPADLTERKHRVVVVAVSEYGKEENHAFDLLILR